MIKLVKIVIDGEQQYKAYIFNEEDEKNAIEECDRILKDNDVSDGCTLTTLEDYIAVNSHLAEKFDDSMNMDNYMEYNEDAKEDLIIEISETMCKNNWSEDMLKMVSNYMGIHSEK